MDPISQLSKRVDAYLARTGGNPTTLGIEIARNSALIFRLREGCITGKTAKRISDFLDRMDRPRRKRSA